MIMHIEINGRVLQVDYSPGSRGNWDHPEDPDSFEFLDLDQIFDPKVCYLKVLEKCREAYGERSL